MYDRYNIVFDFDGTIVDTRPGIVKSMQYALEKLGIRGYPAADIEKLIGKPLEEMLAEVLGEKCTTARIRDGVILFRSRYGNEGLKESELYDGIIQALNALAEFDIDLHILSSKPTDFVVKICTSFSILDFFRHINGVDLRGLSPNKSDRLGEMIKQLNLDPEKTVMYGDRSDDCIAAFNNNIQIIGAAYGFGGYDELKSQGCRTICYKPNELIKWVISNNWGNQ